MVVGTVLWAINDFVEFETKSCKKFCKFLRVSCLLFRP